MTSRRDATAATLAPGADEIEIDGPFAPIDSAPKDGRLVVGELAGGERILMRWRSQKKSIEEDGPDDQAEASYWAQWQTDVGVEPLRWAPTRRDIDEVPGRPRDAG